MDDRLQQLIREIGDAPAFPWNQQELADGTCDPSSHSGMTYRQWLIGQALNGACACPDLGTSCLDESCDGIFGTVVFLIARLARERMEAEK